jgi:hypothetical protein
MSAAAPAIQRTAQKVVDTKSERPPIQAASSESGLLETSASEAIRQLAYALWQDRGCPIGSAEIDWIEAEQKLRERVSIVGRA